jgi:ferritin-like metal-binding protein YciE
MNPMATDKSTELLTEHLEDARAMELALARTLGAHIAMTPASRYRAGLERHLEETRGHAKQLDGRIRQLGGKRSAAELGAAAVKGVRQLRKVPGVARAEGEIKGTLASTDDLAIPKYDSLSAGYDELTVADIRRAISEIDDDARIAAVRNYEQRHKQRQGVIELTERKPAERGSQRS